MNAFVPSIAGCRPSSAALPQGRALCSSHRPAAATPFFASTAFGASVPARIAPQTPRTGVRMDVTVVVGDNEPVEAALRRFKKDVTRSGHLFELRRRRYFETNTEKRIRKAAAARRKARMAARSGNRQNSHSGGNNNSSNNNNSSAPKPSADTSTTSTEGLNKPRV